MSSEEQPGSEMNNESTSVDDGTIKNFVVGEIPCTFTEVGHVLSKSASAEKLWLKLIDVATSLEIPSGCMVSLKKRISTDTITYPSALYEILQAWQQKFTFDATLQNLVKVLQKHELNDCADELQIHFKIFDDAYAVSNLKKLKYGNEASTLKPLPDHLKSWLNNKIVKFQQHQIKLETLTAKIATEVDEKILDELCDSKTTCIVKDNVPDSLDYYVNRTVTSRRVLKIEVLKETCKDVFVIEGMEKHKLTLLIPDNESEDVSGNQLINLTVRFILLQHKPDFYDICKLTSVPVHWIKFENGKLELVKSSGCVKNLQKYVDDSQDTFFENELAFRQDEHVIVIADSPGMGKSCLLANIGHQIMKNQTTTLVQFIILKEFVEALTMKEIDMDSIVNAIAEKSSEFEFGRKFVEYALKNQPCVLLFDGLDEVLPNQMTTAKEILVTASNFPFSKVFVATRPHFRNEIENTLHALAYTIQPFNEINQVNFLIEFWKRNGAIANESLNQFTDECVTQLSSKMTDSDRHIAGIPLQCRLLAETYKEQAIRCSKVGYQVYESADSVVMVDSIFGIYDRHMKLRFSNKQKSGSKEYAIIKYAHMYLALKLLFPEHAPQFESLYSSSIDLYQLCGLGIVEATHSKDIRFVHRTFAEFLVAWLAHECGKIAKISRHRDSLRSILLKLTQHEMDMFTTFGKYIQFKLFKFDFTGICYFLNGFAKKNTAEPPTSIEFSQQLLPFYYASAFHNYGNIPNIVTPSVAKGNLATVYELSSCNLLYVVALHSSVELMKTFYSNVKFTQSHFMRIAKSDESDAFSITPLHVAVQRGHYSLVAWMLKKFKKLEPRYLIHFCVYNSAFDRKGIVDEKIQIIKILSKINKEWIDEELPDQTTPLIRWSIHPDLLECLIQEGANIDIIDKDGNTVLHKITERNEFTGESYHQIVNALQKQKFQHFNQPNKQHATPLHYAVEHVELLSKTLELLIFNGGDVNAVDEQGDSLLFYSIRKKRCVEFIRKMIIFGANTNHHNWMGQNALHISVQERNLEALKYFIETHKTINVNDTDSNGNTPLHLSMLQSTRFKETEPMQLLLINNGANVNAVNELHAVPFIYSFEQANPPNLNIIKEMEEYGLGITKVLASQALTTAFIENDTLERTPLDVLEYLIFKGGHLTFTHNFWKWNGSTDQNTACIRNLIQFTHVTSGLLAKSREHGILTQQHCIELENLETSLKSKLFYGIVQAECSSFERLYVILMGEQEQQSAVEELREWLKGARNKILQTVHPRLKEIIHSNNSTVVAVLTNSAEISVNRIRDTIAHRVQVLEEHEITQASLQSIHVLLVLKCETLTPELMKKLVCLDRLVVCICKMVDDGVQGCEILRDTQTLGDLSKLWFRIDGNLYNLTELFATPNILGQLWKPSTELTKLNIDYFFKVIGYNMGHRISTHVKYVSTNVFNYFLPDKFVFLNINEKDLRFYAKYGQKIGNSSQDIKSLDYVILPQVEKHIFEKICIESGTNVHLVEHDKGSFKMIRTWGSEDNVKKFFKPTRLCEFPSCNCPTSHLVMMIKIFYKDFSGKQEFVTCEFNVDELLPKGIQVFGVEEQIDLLELRALFNDLDKYVLELNLSGFVIVLDVLKRELLSNSIGQHVAQIVYKIVEYLVCPEEHENLQQVAVNTVFPHLAKTVQFSSQSVEKYICMGFLEDRNDLLLFKNDILAFYFIAEMIINQVDTISTNEFLSEIFCNCFNTYTNRVSFNSRDNSEYRTKPIASYKFEQIRLFKFLDVFARNQPDAVYKLLNKVISPQCYKKWIHASVNDNMVDLFKILMKLELNILECDVEDLHKNFVMWEDVVVLSIIHCDVSFVELVAQEYKNHSHLLLENIKLSCFKYDYTNNKSKFECFINVVDVAALKRECQVFEYLLNNHFNETINQPKIHDNITYLCVADTKTHDHVDERKRMMSAIFQNHTTLLQSQPNHYAILAPNIHVDLIIHVINLGIHVYATNNRNQNVLHLCAEYLTPEEYDRVVNVLVEKNHTGLFHGRDKYQNTPLHRAVKHLELCNSTFAIFHSYNVDFNAVNIYNKTPLIEAVLSQKSLRVLNSLIKIGADNKTPSFLHAAACSGNFSALKYFLVSGNGHDVNVTDKLNRYSPLHLTFLHSKKHSNANEMVVLLLQYGADVRALDKDGKTPVDIANLNFCGVQLEACTKEILEMESDFRKWLFEIVHNNMHK